MSILITDEINICIVEFNYYAQNYTIETNFSHAISAESYTEAASWIVQLSSDSPDINIILDPNQVYMNIQIPTSSTLSSSMNTETSTSSTLSTSKASMSTETSYNMLTFTFTPTLSASKVITISTSSSCGSTLQQLGIYIGAALFALFLLTLIICIVAISFCCVYRKRKVLQVDVDSYPLHPINTYTNEPYSDIHQYRKGPLPSLPDNEIYAKIEEEYMDMEACK